LKIRSLYSILILNMFFLGYSQDLEPKLGDKSDGSRSTPIHIIRLIDQDSSSIFPDEKPLMPVSTQYTCNPCHQYETINEGWHFNAGDNTKTDGRKGHPWIFFDSYSATQLPVSIREWEGTFKPEELKFSDLKLLSTFGRHLAGNKRFETDSLHALENYWRWQVSGTMEVNCMVCHDTEQGYDHAEFAAQMQRQNFRWAATAPLVYAEVQGSAVQLPDNYDIYQGVVPDDPRKIPPTVSYDADRFNHKNNVLMQITRKIKTDNCYFCHSVKTVDPDRSERWHFDEDVHLKAGLVCVDCHRHGLDHNMVRGYEGEAEDYENPSVASLSCKGCHIGSDTGDQSEKGRLGAPYPAHNGLPPVHFEKMSCTSCHSGTWPADKAFGMKTSMAHGLGMHTVNRSDETLPHLQGPVFYREENDQITPGYIMWPSFWGDDTGAGVKPVAIEENIQTFRDLIGHIDSLRTGNWPMLSDSVLTTILDSIKVLGIAENPVYVSGGYEYKVNTGGILVRSESSDGDPYLWPMAHDVRPASQSLGINGCSDCHNASSELYYGDVYRNTAVLSSAGETLSMYNFMEVNPVAAWIFSFSFLFRPVLKIVILLSIFIILSTLIFGASRGVSAIIQYLASENGKGGKK